MYDHLWLIYPAKMVDCSIVNVALPKVKGPVTGTSPSIVWSEVGLCLGEEGERAKASLRCTSSMARYQGCQLSRDGSHVGKAMP